MKISMRACVRQALAKTKLFSVLLGASLAVAAFAAPAGAVVVSFSGGAGGTDPLGHSYQASDSQGAWGSPGLGSGTLAFNLGNFSNSAGSFATEFDFTILGGVSGDIDTTPASGPFGSESTTRFSNITDGILWNTVFVNSNAARFIAPAGTQIDVGDVFFVNVVFTGPVDLQNFSFAALWTDQPTSVPEPGTLALLASGLIGLGLMRRKARA